MIIGEGIDIPEFQSRRKRVLEELKDGIAIIFAGEGAPPLVGHWTPDWNFYYLTGIRDEPGAAVLFDPKNPDPKRRAILFLKPLNPEIEEWDGYRDRVSAKLKQQTGFDTVMRTYHLPRTLTAAARRAGRMVCLHPFTTYDAPVSPDLVTFRKVLERSVGIRLDERTNLLASMRSVKSKAEVAIMQRAADASLEGYRVAARAIRPGATERQVQHALESGFIAGGGVGTGYNSIVGSGLNTTVLHYNININTLEAGDLLLIDAGARVGAYTADVTRTFPISGRFNNDQRDIYEIVLAALKAATKAARPGATFADLDAAARKVIDKAGYADNYIHGIGHHLGIEVHDITPEGPLKAGNIITIEPGIYLPDRKIGIRLEDDILITPSGPRNLTEAIPREAKEVEAMVGASSRQTAPTRQNGGAISQSRRGDTRRRQPRPARAKS